MIGDGISCGDGWSLTMVVIVMMPASYVECNSQREEACGWNRVCVHVCVPVHGYVWCVCLVVCRTMRVCSRLVTGRKLSSEKERVVVMGIVLWCVALVLYCQLIG